MYMTRDKRPTLWIDITELFGHFALVCHPTGISRVIINLSDALAAEHGTVFGNVRPIFWHPVLRRPFAVDEPGLGPLAKFFPALRTKYASKGWTIPPIRSGMKKGFMTAVPKPLRFWLFPYLHGVTHFHSWARQAGIRVSPIELACHDCVFVPGSFWLDGYTPHLGALARAKRTAVVGFVHDVLLLSNPEWLPPRHGQQFQRGVDTFLPNCAAIVCNSANTRNELKKYAPRLRNVPIKVCRLADSPQSSPNGCLPAELAKFCGQRYALFVSTLTPRKNHHLAVTAWQKLWNILGKDTPWLVFVGDGAPDRALAELLARSDSYGKRVIRLADVDDATLDALYANAWITLYPSLGEGYGLPVAEALAHGKVCLVTHCGAIEEVAPTLVDLIEPADADALVKRIVDYLANPTQLAAREKLIRKHYRPTRWEETAREVRTVLEHASTHAETSRS
jgi:glycosyltransferase involved in cell wall biosynthesis